MGNYWGWKSCILWYFGFPMRHLVYTAASYVNQAPKKRASTPYMDTGNIGVICRTRRKMSSYVGPCWQKGEGSFVVPWGLKRGYFPRSLYIPWHTEYPPPHTPRFVFISTRNMHLKSPDLVAWILSILISVYTTLPYACLYIHYNV